MDGSKDAVLASSSFFLRIKTTRPTRTAPPTAVAVAAPGPMPPPDKLIFPPLPLPEVGGFSTGISTVGFVGGVTDGAGAIADGTRVITDGAGATTDGAGVITDGTRVIADGEGVGANDFVGVGPK